MNFFGRLLCRLCGIDPRNPEISVESLRLSGKYLDLKFSSIDSLGTFKPSGFVNMNEWIKICETDIPLSTVEYELDNISILIRDKNFYAFTLDVFALSFRFNMIKEGVNSLIRGAFKNLGSLDLIFSAPNNPGYPPMIYMKTNLVGSLAVLPIKKFNFYWCRDSHLYFVNMEAWPIFHCKNESEIHECFDRVVNSEHPLYKRAMNLPLCDSQPGSF